MDRPLLLFRDRHENPKKCSLVPLRGTAGIRWFEYPCEEPVDATGHVLLHPEGELLDASVGELGLLLVDSSWRRLPKLLRKVAGAPPRRRLPPLITAYPRRSNHFDDPDGGLASIEALYAALALMGNPRPELLAHYRWADEFLAANPQLPAA